MREAGGGNREGGSGKSLSPLPAIRFPLPDCHHTETF
jgi:hypothetical protein